MDAKDRRTAVPLMLVLVVLMPWKAHCVELVQHPESQTQFLGTLSTFYCQGSNFSDVDWILNGSHALRNSDNTGIEKREMVHVVNSTISLELLVPGININNASLIRCYGLRFLPSSMIGNYTESNVAQLLLQGPPGKVVNFKGTNTSDTTISLSWEPPYHLPGTSCCSQYDINITHAVTNTEILSNVTTTEVISFTVDRDRLCDTYIVTIVAHNPAGEGDMFLTPWSLGGFFELDSVIHELYYEDRDIVLDVDVTIGGYCLNQVDNASLSTKCPRYDVSTTTNNITASTTDSTHTTDFKVPLPFADEMCYYEVALDNNIAALRQDISTYDVSSATIVSTPPGAVCLSCQYLPNSLARGCDLEVINNEFYDDRYSDTLLQGEAQLCVAVQYGGYFTVNIYDVNYDGTRSARPAITFSDVIIENPNTTSVVDNNVMGTSYTSTIVAVVVVFVVVVIVVIVVVILILVFLKKNNNSSNVGEDETDFGGVEVNDEVTSWAQWFAILHQNINSNIPLTVKLKKKKDAKLTLEVVISSVKRD